MLKFLKKKKNKHPLLLNDWGRTNDSGITAELCPWMLAGPGSICYPTARILNPLKRPEAISLGSAVHLRGELLVLPPEGKISIGDYCYVGEGSRLWAMKGIFVGNRVLISHNVNIFDNDTHPIDDAAARHQQFKRIITSGHPADIDLRAEKVTILDDVLVGCNSIILAGITVGEGAVIGADSVVTKDVPPYHVVAGNPARIIRAIHRNPSGEAR